MSDRLRALWRRVRYGRSNRRYLESAARCLVSGDVTFYQSEDGYLRASAKRGPYNQVEQALEWLDWQRSGAASPREQTQ